MIKRAQEILIDRNIQVARYVMQIGIFTCLLLALIASFIFEYNMHWYILAGTIPIFICIWLLNNGWHQTSRMIASFYFPTLVIIVSYLTKYDRLSTVGTIASNYIDARILLMLAIVIPLTTFSFTEKRNMLLGIAPLAIYVFFFDLVHNLLGVGFMTTSEDPANYFMPMNLYTDVGFIFFTFTILYMKKKAELSELEVLERKWKNDQLLEHLIRMTQSNSILSGNIPQVFTNALNTITEVKTVKRVSIWELNEKTGDMRLVNSNDSQLEDDLTLNVMQEMPNYFQSLSKTGLIVDHNGKLAQYMNKDTAIPKRSLIGMAFYDDGHIAGLVCCEDERFLADWSAEDSLFLKSIVDLISSAFDARQLELQRLQLSRMNQEVNSLNSNLEIKIRERTVQLEERNKSLSEYAFINAHILRGPITRLSGLMNLWNMQKGKDSLEAQEISTMVTESVSELDKVSRQINKNLDELSDLDRDALKKAVLKN